MTNRPYIEQLKGLQVLEGFLTHSQIVRLDTAPLKLFTAPSGSIFVPLHMIVRMRVAAAYTAGNLVLAYTLGSNVYVSTTTSMLLTNAAANSEVILSNSRSTGTIGLADTELGRSVYLRSTATITGGSVTRLRYYITGLLVPIANV